MVLGVALLAAILAGAGSRLWHPIYAAEATVRLPTLTTTAFGGLTPDLEYSDRVANTYTRLVATALLRARVQERLGLAAPPLLEASVHADSELLLVRAEAGTPEGAARVANAGAAVLIGMATEVSRHETATAAGELRGRIRTASAALERARRELELTGTRPAARAAALAVVSAGTVRLRDLRSDFDAAQSPSASPLSILQRAEPPAAAQFPNPGVAPLLGGLLGMLAGAALALQRGRGDSRVRSARDLDARNKPVLGTIPRSTRPGDGRAGRVSALDESFKRLSWNLLVLGERARVVVVAGLDGATETTGVVARLGVALAGGGARVVVVDANLRSPGLQAMLNADESVGLIDVLSGQRSLRAAVQTTAIPNLDVLTTGVTGEDCFEALCEERLPRLVACLRRRYDRVLIDAPSALPFADASLLGSIADGTILVIRPGATDLEAMRIATDGFELANAHLLGVVFDEGSAQAMGSVDSVLQRATADRSGGA